MASKRKYAKQTFSLDSDIVERLKTAAWYYQMPQSHIVEKALEEYFKRFLRLPTIKARPVKKRG